MRRSPYTEQQVQRVCRIYYTASDAARALGCTSHTLRRLCRQYGIEYPRRRRRTADAHE